MCVPPKCPDGSNLPDTFVCPVFTCPVGEKVNERLTASGWIKECIVDVPTDPVLTCNPNEFFDPTIKACVLLVADPSQCGEEEYVIDKGVPGFACYQEQPDNTHCLANIMVSPSGTYTNYSCSPSSGSGSSSSAGANSSASNSSGTSTQSSSANSSVSNSSVSPQQQAFENCELNFGQGNCALNTNSTPCPNSYKQNGITYCVTSPSSGSGSSAASSSGSGSGTSSGSASSSGECDPTSKSYDDCMGRNETPTASQTQQIKQDLKTSGDNALNDYMNSVQTDIDNSKNNGISFKEAPSQLKLAINAMIPQPRACQNIPFTFYGITKNINCAWFEKFKTIFGWFLYIITAIYIFKLAMRPVPS